MILIFLTVTVFASSETRYPSYGSTRANENTGDHFGDYDDIDLDEFTFYGDYRGNVSDISPLMVGLIDDSIFSNIINGGEMGLDIYEFDPENGEFFQSYNDASVIVHSPITLYDGDNDGYDEIYFCGVHNGTSKFMAYEIEDGNLTQKWATDVANHEYNATYPEYGCGFVQRVGFFPTIEGDTTYDMISAPVCGQFSGAEYCLFVGASMTPYGVSQGRANNKPTIYRFDAETGDMTYFDPLDTGTSYSEVWQNGGINWFFAFGLQDGYLTTEQMYADEKVFTPAICDLQNDGDQKIITTFGIYEGSNDYGYGVLVIDINTMTPDTVFSGDGFRRSSATGSYYSSSPSCIFTGLEYEIMIPRESGGDEAIFLYMDPTGGFDYLETGIGIDFQVDADEISQPFFGSYTGEDNSDICVIVDDEGEKTVRLACAKYEGLVGDTLEDDLFTYNGSYDLNPNVVATTGNGYDLGGYAGNDFLISKGLFDHDPDEEDATLLDNGLLDSTGICSMADVDNDGYADVLCIDDLSGSSQISFYTSSVVNTLVDFNRFIPGIYEDIMCTGNQSFYIEEPTLGYDDVEEDHVRVRIDCDNDDTFDHESNYTTYGSDFEGVCLYNESGTYTAKICMDDINNQGSLSECGFYTTIVSDIEGCVNPCYPDCDYETDQVVIVNPEDEEEDDTQTGSEEAIDESVDNFFDQLLGTNQKYRIMAAIAIILATMYGFMKTHREPMIAIAAGMCSAIMLFLLTFLPGWTLVLILFTMIVVILFANTVFNRNKVV